MVPKGVFVILVLIQRANKLKGLEISTGNFMVTRPAKLWVKSQRYITEALRYMNL